MASITSKPYLGGVELTFQPPQRKACSKCKFHFFDAPPEEKCKTHFPKVARLRGWGFSFYARDIFSSTYAHTSCYARDIFSCTHTHTSFYARGIFSLARTHILHALLQMFLLYIHTYFPRRYIHLFLHIHTEEKRRALTKLCPVKRNGMFPWVFKTPGIFKVQF